MEDFESLLLNYDFGGEDVKRLKSLQPMVEESIDIFLALFYGRILTFPHAQHFSLHNNIITRHREKIRLWFLELFHGSYGEAYFEKLKKISQTHVNIALPPHYVNLALHIVRSFLHELIIRNERFDCLKSINKILDINMDVLNGFYSTTEQSNTLQMIHLIYHSLKNNARGVKVFVQPIFNTQTLHIERYECLMRLSEADEIVLPGSFLQIAEKSGHYCELSRCIIGKSLDYFHERTESFSLNLSFEDMKSQRTRDFLKERLSRFHNPSRITFEIVEFQSLDNKALLSECIDLLRSYGCWIAIDDFGAGYSNFDYILSLSPDILKIDGSLIKDIDTNPKHRAIVENIHALARKLNIITVAEFVHSEAILSTLQKIGVDAVQGFYLDSPKAIEKALAS